MIECIFIFGLGLNIVKGFDPHIPKAFKFSANSLAISIDNPMSRLKRPDHWRDNNGGIPN